MKQHLKTSTIIKVILYLIISFIAWDFTYIIKYLAKIPYLGNGERAGVLLTFACIELSASLTNEFIKQELKNKTNGGK